MVLEIHSFCSLLQVIALLIRVTIRPCGVDNMNALYVRIRSYKISVIDSYMLVNTAFSLQRLGFNLSFNYGGYLRRKCRLYIFSFEFLTSCH
jgi:hypothetical protein